ncbi:MAG TPA: hypothetical protein VI386_38565 [Candidatus Sulfotelmatobacter sp.]
MLAKSNLRSFAPSPVRISLALLLTVLLVFPDGLAASDTRCPASSGWQTSGAPLTNPIETFGAAVSGTTSGDVMYVIGGENWNSGTPVFQTQVLHKLVGGVASGTPGTWFHNDLWKDPATNPLEVVGYSRALCGVVNNGYLYTVGGVIHDSKTDQTYGSSTNQVWFAPINPTNGNLGAWQITTALPITTGLQLHGAVVLNNYLYVIGGSTDPVGDNNVSKNNWPTKHVHFTHINSDGTLGKWDFNIVTQTSVNLPDITSPGVGFYKTCPVAYNGSIYVSGGENAGGALSQVVFATPSTTDGTFSAWNPATGLNINGTATTDAAQAVVYNNGIILIAGDQTGHGNDWPCVFQGDVTGGGSITWNINGTNSIPQLPIVVSRNAGATSGSLIFSLGGLHTVNNVPQDQSVIYYRSVP